jgi:hypothetical protein
MLFTLYSISHCRARLLKKVNMSFELDTLGRRGWTGAAAKMDRGVANIVH